jgi:aminopeptidase-like protein
VQPKCEPQLGKRGLYRDMGGYSNARDIEMAMLWVLNLSDGSNSLLDIAERARMPFDSIHDAARLLGRHGLLEQVELHG